MPQMNRDGNDTGKRRAILSDEPWSREDEQAEARRQQRHLSLLSRIPFLVVPVILVLGGLLYYGYELPPLGMNTQPADSTGYQPPPRPEFGVEGSVPRTGVERVLPDPPDGSVPAQAVALQNPLPTEEVTLRRGAVSYANNCAFCHGSSGRGDGPVSESYVPGAPDLTTDRVRNQPSGALFYKITNGILSTPTPETEKYLPREWHAFKGTMTEEDRWAVVAFMKALNDPDVLALSPTPEQTTHPTKPRGVMPGPGPEGPRAPERGEE